MSRWEGKYVIGLTGNIAVGKSVVRQMLQHLGAYTIDADELTHQVMAPGAPAHQPVSEMFGKFVVDDQGRINRAALGAIVFNIPEALAKLEAIIHPIVGQFIGVLIARAKQRVVVVEAIKLIESGMADSMDAVWVVDAAPESQVRRLVEKRKLTLDEARRRIALQNAQADKLKRANVIIKNDASVEETWKQVQAAWNDVARALSGQTAVGQQRPAAPRPPAGQASPAAQAAPQPRTGSTGALRQQPTTSAASVAAASAPTIPSAAAVRPIPSIKLNVRRGMPSNAEAIAQFISRATGQNVTRQDVMMVFGTKSYLLAEDESKDLLALIGWQVENLITRTDELYLDPNAPRDAVLRPLLQSMEDAASQLQSEVSFLFLPATTPPETLQSLVNAGYKAIVLEEIKALAWREVVREAYKDNSGVRGLMKQLRADLVMKPI